MKQKNKPPSVYIIAGPNGAGKTTFACKFLPDFADCYEFVNADLIAGGLSPFAPEAAAIQAGRHLLDRIHKLAREQTDFAFETTLSGRSYLLFLQNLKKSGYKIHLFFLWIHNIDLALERIAGRVRQGGHNVPEDIVRRRFHKGLRNFFHIYRPLADTWTIFDNSTEIPKSIATKDSGGLTILNDSLYAKISESVEEL